MCVKVRIWRGVSQELERLTMAKVWLDFTDAGHHVIDFEGCAMHKGAFLQFLFRWIYYWHCSKSTRKETGKTHLCAMHKGVFWKGLVRYFILIHTQPDEVRVQIYSKGQWGLSLDHCNKSSNHVKMFDNLDGEYLKITYLEEEREELILECIHKLHKLHKQIWDTHYHTYRCNRYVCILMWL